MLPGKHDFARLGYIDGLRAVAVGLVIWFHAQLPGIPNGYLGVDIFFVISGFLITAQIFDGVHAGSFSVTDFYARRILRIFSPLLLVISTALVATCLLPILPVDMTRVALSAIASAAMVSNWYFLPHHDYFSAAAEREPLLHLWSLGVEEQYYLSAPAALWLGVLAHRKGMNLYMLGLFCAVAALASSLTAAVLFAASKPEHVFYSTLLRAWELAAGATAVLSIRQGLVLPRSMARAGVVVGLVAIVVASTFPAVEPGHRFFLQMLVVAGASSVVLCGAFAQGGVAIMLLGLRPMIGLGLVSYSLYLWHWPVLAFWRLIHLDPATPIENALAGVAIPLLLAVLTYVVIERPIRAWRRRGGSAAIRLRTIAHGVGASLLVATIGLAVVVWAAQLNTTDPYRAYAEATARIMDKCRPGFRADRPSHECRLGTGSNVRVLLWGDSHALSASGAVATSADAAGLAAHLEWDGGCLPLPGNALYVGEVILKNCMRQNATVLRRLSSPEFQDVTAVILEAAWALAGGRVAPPARAAESASILAEAMTHTIGQLRALGLRVLVLGPVPAIPHPAPECLFRAHSETDLRRCRYTSAEVDLAQRSTVTALRSATKKFDGTRFVDLAPAFCDMDYCWPGRDRSIYYSDTNHLSGPGARILHDRFKDDLAWAFAAPRRDNSSAPPALNP